MLNASARMWQRCVVCETVRCAEGGGWRGVGVSGVYATNKNEKFLAKFSQRLHNQKSFSTFAFAYVYLRCTYVQSVQVDTLLVYKLHSIVGLHFVVHHLPMNLGCCWCCRRHCYRSVFALTSTYYYYYLYIRRNFKLDFRFIFVSFYLFSSCVLFVPFSTTGVVEQYWICLCLYVRCTLYVPHTASSTASTHHSHSSYDEKTNLCVFVSSSL